MSLFSRVFSAFSPGNRGASIAPSPIINLGSGLRTASITLTSAQIDALFATPVTIIPAVAGYVHCPVNVSLHMTKAAGAWTNNPGISLRHANGGAALLTTATPIGLSSGGAGESFNIVPAVNPNYGVGGPDPTGQAVTVNASADANPGGAATLQITVAYYSARVS